MEGLNHVTTINGNMPAVPSKTPVSLLQELCVKRGVTPKYDLLQVEGAVHEPTFLYRATVGEFVATGQGQSKKKAKHMAAKSVLDAWLSNQPGVAGQNIVIPDTPAQLMSPYDDGIPGNPVGQLQELCMSRRWPPPTYDQVKEEGLPHERTFSVACVIGSKYTEIGEGKSKKIAKRIAANKMMAKLHDLPGDDAANILEHDDDEQMRAYFAKVAEGPVPVLTAQHSNKVQQFHRKLKKKPGQSLSELQTCSLRDGNLNYVQFLQEIAREQNFEVTYVDIEEKTRSNRYQCLVQLSTLPVAVCYGVGDDSKTAQANAALNALEYLRIMVKQ